MATREEVPQSFQWKCVELRPFCLGLGVADLKVPPSVQVGDSLQVLWRLGCRGRVALANALRIRRRLELHVLEAVLNLVEVVSVRKSGGVRGEREGV